MRWADAAPSWLRMTLASSRFLPCCFAIFLLTRLLLVLFVPVAPSSDAAWYFARGMGLAEHGAYSENGIPTAYWPVGYPAMLGVLFTIAGPSLLVGQLGNLAFGAASFALVLLIARELTADELVGRAAVLLLTIYPNNAAYVPLLLSETFYTFLLLLATWLILSARNWKAIVLSGVVFGCATLVKTQTVLFVPLAAAVALARAWSFAELRAGIGRAVIVLTVALLVVTPWTARNYKVFGAPVLVSTNGGMSLLAGNNPSMSGDWWHDYPPADSLLAEAKFSVADQFAADRRARALAWQWITENPGTFLALMPKKLFRFWAPDGEAEWAYQAGAPMYEKHWPWFRGVRFANQAFYAVLIMMCVVAARKLVRIHASPRMFYGFAMAAFFTGLSLVFSGQSRYHFPVMPFVMIYIGWLLLGAPLARDNRASTGQQ